METIKVQGTITRVFFSNPDSPFMAGVLRDDGGTDRRFAGKVVAESGDKVELTGRWGSHPRFGPQFEADTGIVQLNETPEALAHLIASDSRFEGLGNVRARAVVEAALAISDDGELASALRDYPQEIADRSGAPLAAIELAAKTWNEKREHFDALALLVGQGWSNAQAGQIVTKLGLNAPSIVKRDPYTLIGKIPRFGFRTVDTVARQMGIKSTDPKRLFSGVAYCLDHVANDGHTWTTRRELLHEAKQELRPDTLDGDTLIESALNALIAEGAVICETSPAGEEVVADARVFAIERDVFSALIHGLTTPADGVPVDFDGERSQEIMASLTRQQRAAVEGFANLRFGVISGGAGVGKTYTMRAVCEVSDENGLSVALAAPSGKAARKLASSTGRQASTIHKLLEPMYDEATGGFRFTRHAGNPLDVDLVVIDEVSMVSVSLMHALLSALPDHARLLLVGDHHQIPSVTAGAILRDLLREEGRFPGAVHVLTEIVRQAGTLARNTSALLDGVVDPNNSAAWGFQHTERGHEQEAAGTCADVVEILATTSHPEPFDRDLDFAWDIQVLAPMRKGPLGTYALNARLQALRQRLLGNPPPPAVEPNKAPKPLAGDRVLWTKNDYTLGLFNGSQAIVESIKKGGAMDLLVDDGRRVTISAAQRVNLEVAYAMTIHKAQGSEWPAVVLVCSSSHAIMHDRNLLYTGASRASESLTILGDVNGIRSFARQQKSSERRTFGSFFVSGWTAEAA